MKASLLQDPLGRIGVAFALVGIAALCISLFRLAPGHSLDAGGVGAISFIVVGAVALLVRVLRRRR